MPKEFQPTKEQVIEYIHATKYLKKDKKVAYKECIDAASTTPFEGVRFLERSKLYIATLDEVEDTASPALVEAADNTIIKLNTIVDKTLATVESLLDEAETASQKKSAVDASVNLLKAMRPYQTGQR